jgi:hypothetical protein
MPTQNPGDKMMTSLQWSYSSAPVHTSHCKTFIVTSIRKALKEKTCTRRKMLQELFGLGRLAQTAGKHANPCQAEQGGNIQICITFKVKDQADRDGGEGGGDQTRSKGNTISTFGEGHQMLRRTNNSSCMALNCICVDETTGL